MEIKDLTYSCPYGHKKPGQHCLDCAEFDPYVCKVQAEITNNQLNDRVAKNPDADTGPDRMDGYGSR